MSPSEAVVASMTAPPVPTGVTGLISIRRAGAKWTPPLDADGNPDDRVAFYRVQRSESATFTTIAEDDRHVVNTRKRFELPAGTTTAQYIRVASVDEYGTASAWVQVGPLTPGQVANSDVPLTTLTADRLSVTTLSSISANLGTVTAGTFQTGPDGTLRVRMRDANPDRIEWIGASGTTLMRLLAIESSGDATVEALSDLYLDPGPTHAVRVFGGRPLRVDDIKANDAVRPSFPDGLGFPTGAMPRWNDTFTNASAGTNGAVPNQVSGYVKISVNGVERKVPHFPL